MNEEGEQEQHWRSNRVRERFVEEKLRVRAQPYQPKSEQSCWRKVNKVGGGEVASQSRTMLNSQSKSKKKLRGLSVGWKKGN